MPFLAALLCFIPWLPDEGQHRLPSSAGSPHALPALDEPPLHPQGQCRFSVFSGTSLPCVSLPGAQRMDFPLLPSIPFACIHIPGGANNPVFVVCAEFCGNAIPQGGRRSATHREDSSSQQLQAALRSEKSSVYWNVHWKLESCHPWDGTAVETSTAGAGTSCSLATSLLSGLKKSEVGINHIYRPGILV